jgi:uncharacterized protein (TIGR03435 family)
MRASLVLLLSATAIAQTAVFEEASIKPARPGAMGKPFEVTSAGGMMATHISAGRLIQMSYSKTSFLIFGLPSWAENNEWAIVATPAPGTPPVNPPIVNDDFRARIQGLLATRFQMKSHLEKRDLPVYILTLVKGGPKFPEPNGRPYRLFRIGGGAIVHDGASKLDLLVSFLANNFERPVLDETGLTGAYNLNLKWTPDPKAGSAPSAAADPAGPSLFTALEEQLGLKLQAARRPVEVLVIDHIEKPSEN